MQTIYQKMETTELDAAIEALKAEVAEVKAKVYIIDRAEQLRANTANALLKTCLLYTSRCV